MKEPGLNLIEKFHLNELNLDFMGYVRQQNDIFTFHHLIVPNCKKGPYEEWNGAILCGATSHPYLHIIEKTDYDMFLAITSEMIDEKIKGYLDRENLLKIRDILNCFEREYIDQCLCHYKMKEDYFQRPSLEESFIRKRIMNIR